MPNLKRHSRLSEYPTSPLIRRPWLFRVSSAPAMRFSSSALPALQMPQGWPWSCTHLLEPYCPRYSASRLINCSVFSLIRFPAFPPPPFVNCSACPLICLHALSASPLARLSTLRPPLHRYCTFPICKMQALRCTASPIRRLPTAALRNATRRPSFSTSLH